MARLIGQKKREMWFLARFYNASDALKMGLVNTVVPLAELEVETAVVQRNSAQFSDGDSSMQERVERGGRRSGGHPRSRR